jgi:hypothetical protein
MMMKLLAHRLFSRQRRYAKIVLLAFVFATSSFAMAQAPQSSPAPAPAQSSNSSSAAPQQNPEQNNEDKKQDPGQNAPGQNSPGQSKDAPAQPANKTTDPIQPAQTNEQGKVEGTSNDRLFYTLPNFLTLQSGHLPPMPVKDKFKAVALGNFDVVEWPWWGVIAAIGQASNSEPAFRQGWLGYAKRYGVTMADSSVENFMVGAVFPSMLHQDPRFYQSGKGSFFRRTGHAMIRMVVSPTDSGHSQFNYSEIVGAAAAGAISTYSYHPRSTYVSIPTSPYIEFIPSDRTFKNALSTWGTQLYLDALTLEIKEFWPDIHRAIKKHKHNVPASPQP